MEQRFSLITLGVADLARARRFYEAMGWHSDTDPELGVVFFQCPGTVLALWGRDELAADSGVVDGGGWGGGTPAQNVRSPGGGGEGVEQARGGRGPPAGGGGGPIRGGGARGFL